MEPFLADLINNPKVPKIIRYGIVFALCAFIFWVGVVCAINSVTVFGTIFSVILCVLILAAAIYLFIKIHKSKPE